MRKPRLTGISGFSLIEMMVLMVLLTAATAAALKFTDLVFRGTNDMQMRVITRDAVEDMRAILSFSEVCEASLRNLAVTASGTSVPRLKNIQGTELYAAGKRYEHSSIEIQEMTLKERPDEPITALSGVADFVVKIRRLTDTGTLPEIFRVIPMRVTLTDLASRKIATCMSDPLEGGNGGGKAACEAMGGRFVAATLPADNRCIFPQLVITDDPALDSSTEMLHVRQGSTDLLTVSPTGPVGINYSVTGSGGQTMMPTDAGTSLFVNGDQHVSSRLYAGRFLASQFVLAQDVQALHTDWALLNPRGALVSKIPGPLISDRPGYFGMLAENGDLWFDGGEDSFAVMSHTHTGQNVFYHAGITLYWKRPDPSYPPFLPPGAVAGEMLAIRTDGRVGFGYTSRMAEDKIIPPPTCPLPAGVEWPSSDPTHPQPEPPDLCGYGNYKDVRLFVKDNTLAEGNVHVGGSIYANGEPVVSDRRWKLNIRPIADALEGTRAIEGVYHRWKIAPRGTARPEGRDIGFIAQEVEARFPQVVSTGKDGYLRVDYAKLVPVLWQALKQSFSLTDGMESRVDELERMHCEDDPSADFCTGEDNQ